jgi:hypothetical protein
MLKRNDFLTPEEMVISKKRKKNILYSLIFVAIILISALMTILGNKI